MSYHYYFSTSASRPSRKTRVDDACSFVCTAVLFVFLLASSITVCNFLLRASTISISKYPKLEINSIRVSNFSLSNPISAHWNININITKFHRNDITFEFYDNKISIFHDSKNEALWMMSLEPFVLSPNKHTAQFRLEFWGSSAHVDDTTVKDIAEKIVNNHGAVRIKVQFDAWPGIRFRHWIENLWWIRSINRLVSSCDVDLLFRSSDNMRADMLMHDSRACTHWTF